jgi:hypothetical protein
MDDEIIETTYASDSGDTPSESDLRPEPNVTASENSILDQGEYIDSTLQASNGGGSEPSFDETQRMPDYDPRSIDPQIGARGDHEEFVNFGAPPDTVQNTEPGEKWFSSGSSELLELPGTRSSHPFDSVAVSPPPQDNASSSRITELSPDLIDLIVQKVIDRMSENQRPD